MEGNYIVTDTALGKKNAMAMDASKSYQYRVVRLFILALGIVLLALGVWSTIAGRHTGPGWAGIVLGMLVLVGVYLTRPGRRRA